MWFSKPSPRLGRLRVVGLASHTHKGELARRRLRAHQKWTAASSAGPQPCANSFATRPQHGQALQSPGQAREDTNCPTHIKEYAPKRKIRCYHPETQLQNTFSWKHERHAVLTRTGGPGARCQAASQALAPSHFARMWERWRSDTIGAWECKRPDNFTAWEVGGQWSGARRSYVDECAWFHENCVDERVGFHGYGHTLCAPPLVPAGRTG